MSDSSSAKQPSPTKGRWLWFLGAAAATLLLAAFLLLMEKTEPGFARDRGLIRTTYPTGLIPSGTTLWTRLFNRYLDYRRTKFPNPMNWTFPVATTNRCSVHGLLNQCMEITGRQYFIESSVAGGSVLFGATNVQNGAQWVQAFETTLQQANVEWWETREKGFRHEPLVFLDYGHQATVVVSPAAARDYQRKFPSLQLRVR